MSPNITAEVNTLVIVLPKGNPSYPPTACWGIIIEKKTEEDFLKIQIGPGKYDKIYVPPEQVIPFLHTDGSFNDPQRIFVGHEEKIILHLILSTLIQQGIIPKNQPEEAHLPEPSSLIPIQQNTLAIILPQKEHPSEPCWALVGKQMLGGNYEMQIGRFRHFKRSRIIVKPEQIIPVYLTDGSFKSPRQAVRQLRSQILLHMLLMFYSREGTNFLRQLSGPLSTSSFVLVSRRNKIPPTQKPE